MKRHFIEILKKWKENPNRKPLVLSGARQVGKTWILMEFGKCNYDSLAYVNFDRNDRMKSLFSRSFDKKSVISALEVESGVRITPGSTLIVLDEIQECGGALTSLKYWNEFANEYHVAAAGSLVGLSMMEGTGYPVGKTNSMTLYPMSFAEFLEACGEKMLLEVLMSDDNLAIEACSQKSEEFLRRYFVVGGMPAAVASFAESSSFADVRDIQTDILAGYARDFRKHAPSNIAAKIRAIWDAIPKHLSHADRRFSASAVVSADGRKYRQRDLHEPFEWLEAAGVAYRVWNAAKPNLPLSAYRNHAFKLYGLDVGLLAAQSKLPVRAVLEGNRLFTEFKGALAEQFVQQEFRTLGIEPYTWTPSDSTAEVDFLIETENGIVPVEVKAEKNLRAKSLKVFREKFNPAIALRISLSPGAESDGLLDLPLYRIASLRGKI